MATSGDDYYHEGVQDSEVRDGCSCKDEHATALEGVNWHMLPGTLKRIRSHHEAEHRVFDGLPERTLPGALESDADGALLSSSGGLPSPTQTIGVPKTACGEPVVENTFELSEITAESTCRNLAQDEHVSDDSVLKPPPGTWGAGEFEVGGAPDARGSAAEGLCDVKDCLGEQPPLTQLIARTLASSVCESIRAVAPSCCAVCCSVAGVSGVDPSAGHLVEPQRFTGGRRARVSVGEVIVGDSSDSSPRHRYPGPSDILRLEQSFTSTSTDATVMDEQAYVEDQRAHEHATSGSAVLEREPCERFHDQQEHASLDVATMVCLMQEGLALQRESCDHDMRDLPEEPCIRQRNLEDNFVVIDSPPRQPHFSNADDGILGNAHSPAAVKTDYTSPSGESGWSAANVTSISFDERIDDMMLPSATLTKLGQHSQVIANLDAATLLELAVSDEVETPLSRRRFDGAAASVRLAELSQQAVAGMDAVIATEDALSAESTSRGVSLDDPVPPEFVHPDPQVSARRQRTGSGGEPRVPLLKGMPLPSDGACGGNQYSARVAPANSVFFPPPPVHASVRVYHLGHHQTWTPRPGRCNPAAAANAVAAAAGGAAGRFKRGGA